jgi:hypothetical protein
MRSIGVKNRNFVKKLTIAELKRSNNLVDYDVNLLEEAVIDKLPESLWNTWEMADQEIRGIISDTIMDH